MTFRAERARPAVDGSVRWVVIDDAWALHTEACAFLESLRAADRSPNTERVYAGRVALVMSAPKRSRTPEPAPRGAGNQSAQSGSLQAQFIAMVENFDDRSQEWRRLFSEVLGTFFLVLVAAGAG